MIVSCNASYSRVLRVIFSMNVGRYVWHIFPWSHFWMCICFPQWNHTAGCTQTGPPPKTGIGLPQPLLAETPDAREGLAWDLWASRRSRLARVGCLPAWLVSQSVEAGHSGSTTGQSSCSYETITASDPKRYSCGLTDSVLLFTPKCKAEERKYHIREKGYFMLHAAAFLHLFRIFHFSEEPTSFPSTFPFISIFVLHISVLYFLNIFQLSLLCDIFVYWFPGAAVTNFHKLGHLKQEFILPQFWRPDVWDKGVPGPCSLQRLQGGSFLPLPASGGSRHPWACGRLPPVSAFIFTGLLLCVCVSPLLCLRRTLSLDVESPSSRRTWSQTLHCITSAKTLFPYKVPFKVVGLRTWM